MVAHVMSQLMISEIRTLINCNSESSMIFTTLLVFSTESGDETASTPSTQQVSFSGLAIGINRSEAQITVMTVIRVQVMIWIQLV